MMSPKKVDAIKTTLQNKKVLTTKKKIATL